MAVALGCVLLHLPGACADEAEAVDQEISYIWPVSIWNVSFFQPGWLPQQEADAMLQQLASIAEQGFERYLTEVLPKELAVDASFREEFEAADASRVSFAFLRWQKRVFSEVANVPVEDIAWDGKPVPRYAGIDYEWRELYGSPAFNALRRRVQDVANDYLTLVDRDHERQSFRVFLWVEVFREGDSQQPHVHTGANVAGTLFARFTEGSTASQRLSFQDVRGANPPFGRLHHHTPAEGELVLWPSWAPHFVSPQPVNATNVLYSFLLWPPEGPRQFDWEDDPTGDYVYRKVSRVRKTRLQAPRSTGPASGRSEL